MLKEIFISIKEFLRKDKPAISKEANFTISDENDYPIISRYGKYLLIEDSTEYIVLNLSISIAKLLKFANTGVIKIIFDTNILSTVEYTNRNQKILCERNVVYHIFPSNKSALIFLRVKNAL